MLHRSMSLRDEASVSESRSNRAPKSAPLFARVAETPGCATQFETIEEATEMAKEAIEAPPK
jgi:predicted RNase H-like HicB family nuclease